MIHYSNTVYIFSNKFPIKCAETHEYVLRFTVFKLGLSKAVTYKFYADIHCSYDFENGSFRSTYFTSKHVAIEMNRCS